MEWLGAIGAFFLHAICWLAALVALALIPLGLPGIWILVALAAIFAVATGFDVIRWWDLIGFIAIAGIGELIEALAGAVGTKRYGGTKWGMAAAILGGIAGAVFGTTLIPIPILGTLIGVFLFSFAATVAVEYNLARDMRGALRAGYGSFLGRIVAMIVKTSIGIAIVVWMIWRIYFIPA